MTKKIEVRCSNLVITKKSGKEIKCGSFLFEWHKGTFTLLCRKCGVVYHATPQADGSCHIIGIKKGVDILTSSNKKEFNHG